MLGRLTLVTGPEEFLSERAVLAVRAAVKRADAEAELSETSADQLTMETLGEMAGRRYTGSPFLEEWHQRAVAAARKELGDDRYQRLWDRGVATGPDALALFAVADADNPARNFFQAS